MRCSGNGVERIMKRLLLLLGLSIAWAMSADNGNAATWYVDKGATGGAKNGTSWENAYTGITNIVWTAVKPGDVIELAGGDYGGDYVEFKASGTREAPITLKLASDTAKSREAAFFLREMP